MPSSPSDYRATSVDPADWDELVRRFPTYTMYHTTPWLRTVCAEHGLELVLAAVHAGDECVAAWPAMSMRKGPFRILGSPLPGWSTAYLGPLFKPGADLHAALKTLLAHPPLGRWSYFNCRTLDHEGAEVNLEPYGFTRTRRFVTYLLDLQRSEEEIWDSLKGTCRTRIRKARKLGVEVVEETGDGYLDDFWSMSQEVFARSHIQPTYSRSLARRVHDELSAAGRLYVVSAMYEGQRISTLVLPYDDHTIYYWGGAAGSAHRNVPGSNLLHWHTICHARSLGLRTYDMIGGYGGPGRFKQTFNPQEVHNNTHWERSRNKLIGFLKTRYERYANRKRRV